MKKKILIRIGSLRHGGAEKVLVTFLKNLPPDKYEIDLLLNLFAGKYIAEVPSWVTLRYLNYGDMITTNRPHEIPIKAWRKLYQGVLKKWPVLLYRYVLGNKKYDIEFAGIHAMKDEILNSPLKNSRKLVWIHNDLSSQGRYSPAQLIDFLRFDRVLVISEQIRQTFTSLTGGTDANKIVKINNPIDTADILRRAALPNTVPLPDDGLPLFLSVGTVFPQKGFDRLISVHQKLLEEGLPHRILIIGDGVDYQKTLRDVKDRNLEKTVLMSGFVENPYPCFRAADFYVLSSRYEGYPTVLFEALTLKKKIIATDVSGAAEMLENGKLGLLVENSEEGIYNGMKQALTAPESFNKFEEALAEYEFPFSLENSVNNLMQILDDL